MDVTGAACPVQKIETGDGSPGSEALDDFRNRLIWGDNKQVMASLLKEFRGKIDLI